MKKSYLLCTMFILNLFVLEGVKAEVCFTNDEFSHTSLNNQLNDDESFVLEDNDLRLEFYQVGSRPQCNTLQGIEIGLQALALTLDLGTLGAACTGVGTPGALALGLTGLVVHNVQFVVSKIPCTNSDSRESIEKKIKYDICEVLNLNGYQCDPQKIKMNNKNKSI